MVDYTSFSVFGSDIFIKFHKTTDEHLNSSSGKKKHEHVSMFFALNPSVLQSFECFSAVN